MSADHIRSSKIKIGINIEAIKASIKAELDQAAAASGPRGRLKLAVQNAYKLAEDEDPLHQLKCFIYTASALFHHERHGGLTMAQIKRLSSLGYATLRFLGIHPYTSRLSILYSDLHLALSQCYRRAGRHWKAAWEQQLSMQLSGSRKAAINPLQELASATRALRLGHADVAVERLKVVENCGSPPLFEKARLARVVATRLGGDKLGAQELIKETLALEKIGATLRRELTWENLCCEASRTGDLGALVGAVQKKGTHHQASFILEAMLWCYGASQRRWVERLPKLESLVRKRALSVKKPGFIYTAVRQLVFCHDADQATAIRLRDLGEILEQSHRIISIDRELLLWVASARWLARVKAYTLAELALREYVQLSLRLSCGVSRDVLGHAQDLFDRDWHRPMNVSA